MPNTLPLGHVARSARLVRAPLGSLELAGRSAAIGRVQELVRRVAPLDDSVLVTAERGADVESVVRDLHVRSGKAAAPFVAVECGAAALERLLFGDPIEHAPIDLEAVSADSRLAAARGGTLFLREVAELPAAVQARLARVARDGEVRIDGEPATTAIRLIASAAPGIDADVHEHRFRADLFRRLSRWRIDLPALRERSDDVPAIATRLVEDKCEADGLACRTFTQAALALLGALTWPGNMAELRDVLARVVAGSNEDTIQVEHLLPALQLDRAIVPFAPAGSLREARLAVRARLHRGCPAAPWVADGRRRRDPGDPAAKLV